MVTASTAVGQRDRTVLSLLSAPVSRRAFLSVAAAAAISGRMLSRNADAELPAPAFLHLAASSAGKGSVHTYALTDGRCELLGHTTIDSFAAYASHPTLPVLYVARACSQWEYLPRGVIETYAVERSVRPLRLLVQTPMALSATDPRSLSISSCGRYLLVSASTGRAWNAFVLGSDGIPASVAIARKETGAILESQTISLPAPHAVAFSPRGLYAVGTDPGSELMTLLQPSPDGIAVLSRCHLPFGVAESSPAWTCDGNNLIVANTQRRSLSMYAVRPALADRAGLRIHVLSTRRTGTSIKALLAHPTEAGVVTSRCEREGSRLEFWKVCGDQLQVECDTWIPEDVLAFAQHAGVLWLVSDDRLIRVRYQDLRRMGAVKLAQPLHGRRAVVIQSSESNLI